MKTLYLPIYEPGRYHDIAVANKHGLRDAFAAVGECVEWDYIADKGEFVTRFRELIERTQPTLIFTQFQGTDTITPQALSAIRRDYGIPIVNWNGDYWPEHLTAPDMLALLREVDLQLVINGDALPVYAQHGIRADYWQFGYETPVTLLPDVPAHDVVFLGNNYSESRKRLYDVLRALPCNVGIYGNGWPQSEGECTYDFAYGEALYQRAKIAISDSQWPTADGYTSNRIFQAMAAGCFVLNQRFKGCAERLGYIEGLHYAGFDSLDELPHLVERWIDPANDTERKHIACAGQSYTIEEHSFFARVRVLLSEVTL